MGAFILYKNNTTTNYDTESIIFNKLGFKTKQSFNLGLYRLDLYRKQQLNIANFIEGDKFSIYACGSLIYKGLSYYESLQTLLNDFTNDKIEFELLYGNYTVFFYEISNKKISFLIDPSYIKNCYIDFKREIISSHFLAIIHLPDLKFTFNKIAVIESLITGNLIPPSTYVNEIERCCVINYQKIELYFKSIRSIPNRYLIKNNFKSFKEAIQDANSKLEQYFDAQVNLTKEFGAHLGLTGGFDCRLLLLHSELKIKNLKTNSFYREKSEEFHIAKKLANCALIDFESFEEIMDANPFKPVNKEAAFLYLDAQIRSENYVDEEFNLPNYSEMLYKGTGVGFHGCGGEQYRNADRFSGKHNFVKWVENEWLFKIGKDLIKSKELKKELVDSVTLKIKDNLGFDKSYIDILTLKRIQNEILNPANRTTRLNALNQQFFYFAPFTEYQLSQSAYNYIKYLGNYAKFQLTMMRSFNSKLNDIKMTYGFSISEGPSLKNFLESNITQFIPRKWIIFLHRKQKSRKNIIKSNLLENDIFTDLIHGIDISVLINSGYYGKNLYALEELLKIIPIKIQN